VSHIETETSTDSASSSVLYAAYQSMQDGTLGHDIGTGLDDDGILNPIDP
jgi:hypothetical protein